MAADVFFLSIAVGIGPGDVGGDSMKPSLDVCLFINSLFDLGVRPDGIGD